MRTDCRVTDPRGSGAHRGGPVVLSECG